MSDTVGPMRAKGVLWSSTNTHHTYTLAATPSKARSKLASSSALTPKSILKKSPQNFANIPFPIPPIRDITPEPSSPDTDCSYLSGPIRVILDRQSSLRDLADAYSRLGARLKTLSQALHAMGSLLPALIPIVDHKDELVTCLKIHIQSALTDPRAADCGAIPPAGPAKRGMSDDEATYARDLSSLSLAALRFSSLILSSDRMQEIFSVDHLLDIVTALLSIPLSPSLPTPNSRKTYAVSINVISLSTLPKNVLDKVAPRLTYALQRAVDGDLGKEGKKGSVSDGLKAVHELAVQHPKAFLDGLGELLPAIFAHILSPSMANRKQAVHALCGLARAYQDEKSEALTTSLELCLRDASQDLSKLLRGLLAPDATSGSLALCTLASLLVLSRASARVMRLTLNVVPLAMTHKKTGIRMMGDFVWRCLLKELLLQGQQGYGHAGWHVLEKAIDMEIGLGMVAAHSVAENYPAAFDVLLKLIAKGGSLCQEAVTMLQRLVSHAAVEEADAPWTLSKLVPAAMFDGTLLDTPYASIGSVVKSVSEYPQSLGILDIKPIQKSGIRQHWPALLAVWRSAAAKAQASSDGDAPSSLTDTWRSLLDAQAEDEEDLSSSALIRKQLSETLQFFLTSAEITWTSNEPVGLSSPDVKYSFITFLWSIARDAFKPATLRGPASDVLSVLLKEQPGVDFFGAWADLVSDVTVLAPQSEIIRVMDAVGNWFTDDTKALETMWHSSLTSWTSADGNLEDAMFLLSFPFSAKKNDTLNPPQKLWSDVLRIGLFKAEDHGVSTFAVLERLAGCLSAGLWHNFLPTAAKEIVSLLCSDEGVDWSATQILSLCNRTLDYAYGHFFSNSNMGVNSRELLRSLWRHLERIPSQHCFSFLVGIQPGVSHWIQDSGMLIAEDDYESDIGQLYQIILRSLDRVEHAMAKSDVLVKLAPVYLSAFKGYEYGHSESVCVSHVRLHLKTFYSNLPLEGWPTDLVPYVKDMVIPASKERYITLEDQSSGGAPEGIDLATATKILNNISDAMLTPIRDLRNQHVTPYHTKRRLSASDCAPSRKKRKLQHPGDENEPLSTPSKHKRVPNGSLPRNPLKDLVCDGLLNIPPQPTYNLAKADPGSPTSPRKRMIMDCVSVPTMAQLKRERAKLHFNAFSPSRENAQSSVQAAPDCSLYLNRSPNTNYPDTQWPSSDDTVIDSGSPIIESDGKQGWASMCTRTNTPVVGRDMASNSSHCHIPSYTCQQVDMGPSISAG